MLRRFKNSECKTKESFYLNNGAALLEQMIICFNGKCNPIRIYSENGLKDATIDFHDNRELHRDWNYNLYKDDHGNGQFLVKKFKPIADPFNYNSLQLIAEEAAIALQMGKHKNVLKLLCCCLETDLPMLVYEFPANENQISFEGGDPRFSCDGLSKVFRLGLRSGFIQEEEDLSFSEGWLDTTIDLSGGSPVSFGNMFMFSKG
nr:non-functional pseudokinase ZED1-like [Ziziphus jujuba var. spinosa]